MVVKTSFPPASRLRKLVFFKGGGDLRKRPESAAVSEPRRQLSTRLNGRNLKKKEEVAAFLGLRF